MNAARRIIFSLIFFTSSHFQGHLTKVTAKGFYLHLY